MKVPLCLYSVKTSNAENEWKTESYCLFPSPFHGTQVGGRDRKLSLDSRFHFCALTSVDDLNIYSSECKHSIAPKLLLAN